MKVMFIGDLHGQFKILRNAVHNSDAEMFIQVGDFGFWPSTNKHYYTPPERKIHWIEGNHEHIPSILPLKEMTEILPNSIYIPRGTVLKIGNSWVGFMGGADSVDYKLRTRGMDWFPEEEITDEDCERLVKNVDAIGGKLDLLVTHAPPQSVVEANFDPRNLLRFGLSVDWVSVSSVRLEKLWWAIRKPPIICGHMHESVNWGGCRILTINELFEMEL